MMEVYGCRSFNLSFLRFIVINDVKVNLQDQLFRHLWDNILVLFALTKVFMWHLLSKSYWLFISLSVLAFECVEMLIVLRISSQREVCVR